jgi:hypothetical protein
MEIFGEKGAGCTRYGVEAEYCATMGSFSQGKNANFSAKLAALGMELAASKNRHVSVELAISFGLRHLGFSNDSHRTVFW